MRATPNRTLQNGLLAAWFPQKLKSIVLIEFGSKLETLKNLSVKCQWISSRFDLFSKRCLQKPICYEKYGYI